LSVDTRRQPDHFGEGLAVLKRAGLLADPLPRAVALQRVLDLLLEDASCAAQLAQGVEVAEDRHVRVCGVVLVLVAAGVAINALGRTHEREPGPAHHDLRVAALRRYP
jgi:hypothetical protein